MSAQEPAPKLGLALSGGGHRAAFFHIGVLARLAELGLLRRVGVMSTVSGGSIVGALYYLYVKGLLERKPNAEITDEDYVEIVQRLESSYRAGMAENLRGRALSNYPANFRLVSPTFSRTDRIAELYERFFYRPVLPGEGRIDMNDLLISPRGDDGAPISPFDPREDADKVRNAPVPILLINATTLNTGHNWRFEATWIGEPELKGVHDADVDKNVHLLQWRRQALPPDQQKRALGTAVASSACFPGGFAPVSIRNLFARKPPSGEPEPYVVQLVDGGVRDNQGIDALIDMGCRRLIISDGSGQMQDLALPPTRLPALLRRVSSITGKESREQRVLRTYADDQLQVVFLHLQTGLPARSLCPLGAGSIPDWPPEPEPPAVGPEQTKLHPDAQRLVGQMRTDLDAFSDLEASSVMEVGYRVSRAVLAADTSGLRAGAVEAPAPDWRFHVVGKLLEAPTDDYLRHLRVARRRFFKAPAYRLDPVARRFRRAISLRVRKVVGFVLGLAAIAALVVGGLAIAGSSIPAAVVYAVGVGIAMVFVMYVGSGIPGLRTPSRVVLDVALPLLGALLPLWLLGLSQLRSGKSHRRLGPDGYEPGHAAR